MWRMYGVVADFDHDSAIVGPADIDRWFGVAGCGEL
jgi:hypothetical protein